jgi:hypothetical protein
MTQTVWDPFAGTMPFERKQVRVPERGISVPAWIRTLLGLLCIAAAGAILLAFVWRPAAWFGVPALAISVGALMGLDHLAGTRDRREWLFYRLAEHNGWAFRPLKPEMTFGRGARKVRSVDPLSVRVYQQIPELCRSRPGQMIPLQFQAMFWGRIDGDMPFWMGIQQYEVDATFATEALKTDGFDRRGAQGNLYNMALSYDLERDTGIRASLLAEPFDRDGWRDIKTESVEFNRRFSISLRAQGSDGDGQLALLRALSPATQAILIDLHDRYQAQFVIDGNTVHMAGYDRIMSDDDTVVAQHFDQLVHQFAQAATSFKRYAE